MQLPAGEDRMCQLAAQDEFVVSIVPRTRSQLDWSRWHITDAFDAVK